METPALTEIAGPPAEVGRALDTQRRLGLLAVEPRTVRMLPDGRVAVRVRLREPLRTPSRLAVWAYRHPQARELAAALAKALPVVAALFALIVALERAGRGVVAWLAGSFDRATLGGIAVAALLSWLAVSVKRRHVCRGLHCDGCTRRH